MARTGCRSWTERRPKNRSLAGLSPTRGGLLSFADVEPEQEPSRRYRRSLPGAMSSQLARQTWSGLGFGSTMWLGRFRMKRVRYFLICIMIGLGVWCAPASLRAQDAKSSDEKQPDKSQPSADDKKQGRAYSGMYSFQKDGEFVQLT